MKRGPKAAGRAPVVVPSGLGRCPKTLTGAGREMWLDAAAHLKATGRAARVYRYPLLMVCQLYESAMSGGEIGINRLEACRRWLHELGLTPATADDAEAPANEQQNGRARLLSLIERKTARR